MPCYTVSTISVEFKPESIGLLRKAADSLGWSVVELSGHVKVLTGTDTVVIRNGVATGRPENVNLIRKEYSQAVVGASLEWAKAKGWQIQRGSANKVTIKRGT